MATRQLDTLEKQTDFQFHNAVNDHWSSEENEGVASDVEDAIYAQMYFQDTLTPSRRISKSNRAIPVADRRTPPHASLGDQLSVSLVLEREGNTGRRRRRKRRKQSKKRLSLPANLSSIPTSTDEVRQLDPATSSPLEPPKHNRSKSHPSKKAKPLGHFKAHKEVPSEGSAVSDWEMEGDGRDSRKLSAMNGLVSQRLSDSDSLEKSSNSGNESSSDYGSLTPSTPSPSLHSSDMDLSDGEGGGTKLSGDESRDDDEWAINLKDQMGRDLFERKFERLQSGRYYGERFRKCTNCKNKGHHEAVCPWTKRHTVCYLCSGLHHTSARCPHDICRYCFQPKHRLRCLVPWAQNRNYCCNRCYMYGHTAAVCTDLWRQFHNTTYASESLVIIKGSRQRKTSMAFCYNCGLTEHYGFECARESPRGYPLPASQFIAHYDTKIWPSKTFFRLKSNGKIHHKTLPDRKSPTSAQLSKPTSTIDEQEPKFKMPQSKNRPSRLSDPLLPLPFKPHQRHNSLPYNAPVGHLESSHTTNEKDSGRGNRRPQQRRYSDIPESSGVLRSYQQHLDDDSVPGREESPYNDGKWQQQQKRRFSDFPKARQDDLWTSRHHRDDDLRSQLHHHDGRRGSAPVASGGAFPREPLVSPYDSQPTSRRTPPKRKQEISPSEEELDLRHSISRKRPRYDTPLDNDISSDSHRYNQRAKTRNSLLPDPPPPFYVPPHRRYSDSFRSFHNHSHPPLQSTFTPPASLVSEPRHEGPYLLSERGFRSRASGAAYSIEEDQHRHRNSYRY